jgi:hypothetical protein
MTNETSFPGVKAHRSLCRCSVYALLCLFLAALSASAELKPETRAAYQEYVGTVDAAQAARNASPGSFLWIDRDSGRRQSVENGQVATEQIKSFTVPGGMIQHWIGGIFLPGATIARVEKVDQDYADYSKFYAPDISRVKVLSHSGNHFVVSYRITKTKVLTAVLETVHAIDYVPLPPRRMAIRSHSQSVRQVENAGRPDERLLAEGDGSGFLWAMDSYWRMEERNGGVFLECEAVTLSRGVPFGMGGLIGPILDSFAEESLKKTMEQKRQAVAGTK